MKLVVFILALGLFCHGIAQKASWESVAIERGEEINYAIKYGFLKVGSAQIYIYPEFEIIEGQTYYQIQLKIKTARWLKVFSSLDLCFESFIHAQKFRPHHATRIFQLGNEVDSQDDLFTYRDSIEVITIRVKPKRRYHNKYLLEAHFTDLLGVYLYFRSRNLDLSKQEKTHLYITNVLHSIEISPHAQLKKYKRYEAILPVEDELPVRKCFIDFSMDKSNHPMKIRLYTDLGSFYFVKIS